jgi:hypothetical protein
MARDFSKTPISLREGLVIVAIFLVIFGGILQIFWLFYIGIFVILALIIERAISLLFYPGKSGKFGFN